MQRTDVLVIGGGIAGVSVGYFLAEAGRRVILVEAEATLAYHSTGRSAALLFENYGHPAARPLTKASRAFLATPPDGLADGPLMSPRGALIIARPDQTEHLQQVVVDGLSTGTELLGPEQVGAMVPALRTDLLAGAWWEPGAMDLDVAAIHQMFVRGMRRAGAEIRTRAPLTRLHRRRDGWRAVAGGEEIICDVAVNAAGAWCDLVAALAGIRPIGLVPRRRTAFMVPGDEGWKRWPLVVDVDHDFYFRPDGTQLLCSPADETPCSPGDARPEEADIALAIERINAATTLGIRTVRSAWAGLRSFVSDEAMVIGFDASTTGFFWLAGQGGTGIQTSPGAGRLAAHLIHPGEAPAELTALGVDTAALSPARRLGQG